jgi:hypothetical protein
MTKRRNASPSSDFELTIRPHPAREGWRVLRVAYEKIPETEAKIALALEALAAPGVRPRSSEDTLQQERDRVAV